MANIYDYNTLRQPAPPTAPLPGAVDIEIVADNPEASDFDPATGTVRVVGPDGEVTIGPAPDDDDVDDKDHFANLAMKIDGAELSRIADELLRNIELDDTSRADWLEVTSLGIDLMGLMLRRPPSAQTGGAQLEGTSKANHPVLKEAVLRFQANARGELLPTDGPVKVRNDGEQSEATDLLAQALEDDLNHYLTTVATEYYPDTDRLLLFVGFRGCGFKKVYICPIRNRPISESIDAKDLIVSNAATDLKSCGRVTHRVMMRPSTLKRMQLMGAYRDVALPVGLPVNNNAVDQKIAQVQGVQPQTMMADARDQDREILECYCELEIRGYEHKERSKVTGLPLPWKVTIDKDSRQVLEVRRNWDADDDQCLPRTVFVKYPFVPGFGFYDLGLLQICGDMALAATAGWREMLDAGAFSCFPGFLYLKSLAKQLTNQFRIPPGGGLGIDAAGVDDIRKAIMPLPYQPPNQAMMALIQDVVQTAQRVAGTAELPVGEGRQDAPVGTTLALIEQATKVIDAVHKRLHQAQGQEFQLLKDRFMDDPEALWRHNKKSKVLKLLMAQDAAVDPSMAAAEDAKEQAQDRCRRKFVAALADCSLVPVADPNTSSQMARIMKAVAVKQLQAANPQLYDAREVDTRILRAIGWTDIDGLFAPPAPPNAQPDPVAQASAMTGQAQVMAAQARMLDAQTKAQDSKTKAATAMTGQQLDAQKLQTQRSLGVLNLAREQVIHQSDAERAARETAIDSQHRVDDRNADLLKHHIATQADNLRHFNPPPRPMSPLDRPGSFASGGRVVDNQAIDGLADAVKRLVEMQSAPRLIMRDNDGRPVGVRIDPNAVATAHIERQVLSDGSVVLEVPADKVN